MESFWNFLFVGILVIVFWVSVWDSAEILVNKLLEDYDEDDDTHRLIAFTVLSVVSVFILWYIGAVKSL